MTIDAHYIPAFSIEDVLLDKDTGAPLSGGLVYFEEDLQPHDLKPVYQITGTSPNYTFTQLPNPMQLSSIGTFEDSLDNPTVPYFYPFDSDGNPQYYRVRVTSSTGVPQFVRDSVPYIPQDLNPATSDQSFTNQLSDPQFSNVLFDTTNGSKVFTFTAAVNKVTAIAADWDLIVTGTGTVTLTQLTPVGSLNVPTNPGTILEISSSGSISLLRLRQRIYGSPNLFSSGNISGTIVLAALSSGSPTIDLLYSQSAGTIVNQVILTAQPVITDGYKVYYGEVALGQSTNPNSYPNAYIDIIIDLPVNLDIAITSVQVVFTGEDVVAQVPYDQATNDRQSDFLFHYYQPQLNFKPIPSLLTGWDFPLNPAQLGSTQTVTTTPAYIWDQTIMASATGSPAVVRGSNPRGVLGVTTGVATEAFYMLQYLSGSEAMETVLSNLAVNISGWATHNNVVARVYLYSGNTSSTIPTLPTTIGTIATTGIFTLTAADWTLIPQPSGNAMSATLGTADANSDPALFGWDTSSFYGQTINFAIVVTFQVPTSGTNVILNSISCVPGDIPTRPAPQTFDEVLRECQRYYEMSYGAGGQQGVNPSVANALFIQQNSQKVTGSTTASAFSTPFTIKYQVRKISATPTVSFYSALGVSGGLDAFIYYLDGATVLQSATAAIAAASFFAANSIGNSSAQYIPNSGAAMASTGSAGAATVYSGAGVRFHYVIDSRLGVV